MARRTPSSDPTIAALAQQVQDMLRRDVHDLRERLFPHVPHGMADVPPRDYLQYIYDQWGNPAFRMTHLRRVGPSYFVKIARAVLKEFGQPPLVPSPGALEPPAQPPPPPSLPPAPLVETPDIALEQHVASGLQPDTPPQIP